MPSCARRTLFAERFARPRLLVVDEAHVYAGAMAAELTLLMRRAWLRWGITDPRDVQGIATSATMHQGIDDGPARLRKFAAALLSKDLSDVQAIVGRRVLPVSSTPEVSASLSPPGALAALDTNFATLKDELVKDEPEVILDDAEEPRAKALRAIDTLRPGWAPPAGSSLPAAQLLYLALEPIGWVRALRRDLNLAPARADRLGEHLFGAGGTSAERDQATHRILEILALARESAGDVPLLPVRIHATVRGPHGVYACLNGACAQAVLPGVLGKLYTEPVGQCACGCGVYELRVCDSCRQSFVLGAKGVGDDGASALVQQRVRARAGDRDRKGADKDDVSLFCFQDRWDDGEPFPSGKDQAPEKVPIRTDSAPCRLAQGRILWRFPGGDLKGPARALAGVKCPRCSTQLPRRAAVRRVEAGTDAALLVLIDGVYPSLPMHRNAASRRLRGEGRRLLLFADNRQVAASLAAKVEESHDTLLARRILVEALDSAVSQGGSVKAVAIEQAIIEAVTRDDFTTVASLKAQLAAARAAAQTEGVDFDRLCQAITRHPEREELSNHDAASEQDLARMLLVRELGRRPARLGNLEANGVVVVEYGIPFPAARHPEVRQAFPGDTWNALVATLLDTLRTDGVCKIPGLGRYTDFVPRKLLGHPLIKAPRRGVTGRARRRGRREMGKGPRHPRACWSRAELDGRSPPRICRQGAHDGARPSVHHASARARRGLGRARAQCSGEQPATVAVACPHPADGRSRAARGRFFTCCASVHLTAGRSSAVRTAGPPGRERWPMCARPLIAAGHSSGSRRGASSTGATAWWPGPPARTGSSAGA